MKKRIFFLKVSFERICYTLYSRYFREAFCMKKKSLIERTIFLSVIQCILLLAVFVMYLMISYRTAADSLEKNMHNLMQIYGKELEGKIDNADMLLERLIYKNTDYDMLQSPEENDRYYASVKVKDFIEEQTAYDYYIDAVVVAENMSSVISF